MSLPHEATVSPPAPLTGETGNPVFDFRAGFRRAASLIQRALILLGLLLALLGIFTSLGAGCEGPRVAAWVFLVGAVLLTGGVAWGFLWRGWLRRAFQKAHGPVA